MKKYVIFTDGSCWPNPGGMGGWGALVILDGENMRHFLKGGETNTTNNRMELLAVIEAFKFLKEPCIVDLVSDSKYVRNGITKWIHGWKKNGWMTSAYGGRPPAPIKNKDLWEQLDRLVQHHQIKWKWVPGHSGVSGNEQADQLAREGREDLIQGSKMLSAAAL